VREVNGFVAPGFEPVVDALIESADSAGEDGVAVAATIEGETIVDIWSGDADAGPWQRDTMCCIFSCTKGLASLCVHILADRGLLDVGAPVVRYWPEYGAQGKEATLVRHFLNHSAGVVTLPRYYEVLPAGNAGLSDSASIAEHLAASPPSWEPGTACGYHALTFGWLVGELVKRIDGRTIGRFFAEEVAGPLGLDAFIGLHQEAETRVTDARAPRLGSPQADTATAQIDALLPAAREQLLAGDISSPEALMFGALFIPPDVSDISEWIVQLMNDPIIRRAELAGGNGIASARALADMYVPLANAGRAANGTQLVSPESIERFSTPQPLADGTETGYALGYAVYPAGAGIADVDGRSFGHSGAGGNLGLADPGRRLSYAYVKNRMVYDIDAASAPLRAVYRVLGYGTLDEAALEAAP